MLLNFIHFLEILGINWDAQLSSGKPSQPPDWELIALIMVTISQIPKLSIPVWGQIGFTLSMPKYL